MNDLSHLPDKYQRLVIRYMQTLNKTKAYFDTYDCSWEAACKNHNTVFNKPEVKDAIQAMLDQELMGKSEVLYRLQELARGAIGNYLEANGDVNLTRLLEDGKGYLIKGIKVTRQGTTIDFYDYQHAVETVAKIEGLYTDGHTQVNVNVSESLEDKLKQLRDKID